MTDDHWLYAVRRAGKPEDYRDTEAYVTAICREAGVKVQFGLKPMSDAEPTREPGSDDL